MIQLVTSNWNGGQDCNYGSGSFGFSFGDLPVAGDLWVCMEGWALQPGDTPIAITPPPGWSMISSDQTKQAGAVIFYRIMNGSEGSGPFNATFSSFPQSNYLSNVYRSTANGLHVAATSSNSAVDQNPLTGSIAGSGASQLVLAAACDRGSGGVYDPNYPHLATGTGATTFTAVAQGAGPGFQVFEDNLGSASPFTTLGGGLYSVTTDGSSTTHFAVTPGNFDGAPLPQVRPWGVAMLTITETQPPAPKALDVMAKVTVSLAVEGADGGIRRDLAPIWYQPIAVDGALMQLVLQPGDNTVPIPNGASLLLLELTTAAPVLTLKGAASDVGITLTPATHALGLPLLLPLGANPTVILNNAGARVYAVQAVIL